jgi:hypothetical protein
MPYDNECGQCHAMVPFDMSVDPKTSRNVFPQRAVSCPKCDATYVLWYQSEPSKVNAAHLQPMQQAAVAELDRRRADPKAVVHFDEIARATVASAPDVPPDAEAREYCVDEVRRFLLARDARR